MSKYENYKINLATRDEEKNKRVGTRVRKKAETETENGN